MNFVRPLRFVLITLSFLSASGIARWGLAEVSPLDLVGESAALCLEVPRLEQTWKRWEQSRVADRVRAFPPFDRFVNGVSFQQWTALDKSVGVATGQTLTEQLLGLCAESLVVAVYLPEGARPQGVIIARARDEASLLRAVETWGKLESTHVDQARQHLGQTYVQRAKSPKSKEVLFFAVIERTLILSDREVLVRQAIELQQAAAARDAATTPLEPSAAMERSLRTSPLYRTAHGRLKDDAIAFLHVNARAWDKALQAGTNGNADALSAMRVWRHVSAMAGSLRFEEGLSLDVIAELDRSQLSGDWSRIVQSAQPTTDAESRIPDETLLAVTWNGTARPLIQWWLETMPEAKTDDFQRGRRALASLLSGRDPFDDVLPGLLSRGQFQLTEGRDNVAGAAPFELLGELGWSSEVDAASSSDVSTLATSLDNALQFGLNLIAVHLTHESAELNLAISSESSGAATIRFLRGLTFVEPAYSIATGRLLVASSRAALSRGLAPVTPTVPRSPTRLTSHQQRFFPGMSQLVWLDAARTRQALATHSDWVSGMLAQRNPESKPEIALRLAHLVEVLKLFDSAFLAGRLDGDHVHLVVGGAIDEP